MSTSFNVYPTSGIIPTFAEVARECRHQFDAFLTEVGIATGATISIGFRSCANHEGFNIDDVSAFRWPDRCGCYLWVGIDGIPGGTDGYFRLNDELKYDYLRSDIIPYVKNTLLRDEFETALQVGHYWRFRRSAGQPGVVNILYGLLAGSIGKLTDGIIYSDDGAWDYQQMPIRARDFLTSYFRADKVTDAEERRWVIASIDGAREDLGDLKEGK